MATAIAESEAMLRRMKGSIAQRQRAGEDVPAAELDQVTKLELRLSNMRAVLEAQELSRD
jgi:hypothetical protein